MHGAVMGAVVIYCSNGHEVRGSTVRTVHAYVARGYHGDVSAPSVISQ